MAKSTLDVLTEAYHLLDDKRRWMQGYDAINNEGDEVLPQSPHAVRWCALGALYKQAPASAAFSDARALLADALDGDDDQDDADVVSSVNDGRDGYRRIRAAFRKAIRTLGSKP